MQIAADLTDSLCSCGLTKQFEPVSREGYNSPPPVDPSAKGKSIWKLFPELKDTAVDRELRKVIEDHVQVSYESLP